VRRSCAAAAIISAAVAFRLGEPFRKWYGTDRRRHHGGDDEADERSDAIRRRCDGRSVVARRHMMPIRRREIRAKMVTGRVTVRGGRNVTADDLVTMKMDGWMDVFGTSQNRRSMLDGHYRLFRIDLCV